MLLNYGMRTKAVLSLYAALRKYIDIFEYTTNNPVIGLANHPYLILSCANTTSVAICTASACITYISIIETIGDYVVGGGWHKYRMLNSCPRIGPLPPPHIMVATSASIKYNVAPYVASSFGIVYDEVYAYTQNLTSD